MGDIGALANALKGNPTLQNLQQGGYQQVAPTAAAPQLNMSAYSPAAIQAAQAQAAQAQNTNINQSQANTFLGAQQNLVAQLQQQAAGGGPNPAQQQYQQNTQQAIAQQAALGAARGNQNPGLNAYQNAQQAASMQQGMAGQEAINQSNQQLAAEQGLGSALNSYGGQQIGLAENQAGLNQQTSLANLNAIQGVNLANMGAQNETNQFNTTTQTAAAQAGNAAQQAQYQYGQNLIAQGQNQTNQIIGGMATNAANAANTFTAGAIGGGLNAGAAIGTSAATSGGSNPGSGTQASTDGSSSDFSGNYDASLAPDGSSFDKVGGVFSKPGSGVPLRVGEEGPEAVVPLDGSQGDPHKFLDQMMKKLAAGNPGKAVEHGNAIAALLQMINKHGAEIAKLKKKGK